MSNTEPTIEKSKLAISGTKSITKSSEQNIKGGMKTSISKILNTKSLVGKFVQKNGKDTLNKITKIIESAELIGKNILIVEINNVDNSHVTINTETLEMEILKVKGTNYIIKGVTNPIITIGGINITTVGGITINTETLEEVNEIEIADGRIINGIHTNESITIGGVTILKANLKGDDEYNNGYGININSKTLKEIKVKGYISKQAKIGGINIAKVQANYETTTMIINSDSKIIDGKTLKQFNGLKVKGTNNIVTDYNEQILILQGKEIRKVEINNEKWMYIDNKTIEKIIIEIKKIDGTKEIITEFLGGEKNKSNIGQSSGSNGKTLFFNTSNLKEIPITEIFSDKNK